MVGKVEHFRGYGKSRKFWWKVLLWPDLQTFHAHGRVTPDKSGKVRATAMHHPHVYYENNDTKRRRPLKVIGTIHFVRDRWDMETVAHECFHAAAHYIRATKSLPLGVDDDNMVKEEQVCYQMGRLVSNVYRKLWDLNPNPRWERG